jgi:RNA polymerase sigma factor (sigma-70 family)
MALPPTLAEAQEEEGDANIDGITGHEPLIADTTCARLEQMQTQRQLVEVVARLPASERRIVFTHYFQRHTFEEIALDMGLTKGRVSHLHHAALRRMREWGSAKDLPPPAT